MENKAILIWGNDYEGLYVNDKLVDEGKIPMNEGHSRFQYFIQLSKTYNFNLEDMLEDFLTPEDAAKTEEYGCFPDIITKFSGKYRGLVNGRASNE
jgi:hypothetical protein